MRRWHGEGKSMNEIANLLQRDWHTVSSHVNEPDAPRRVGRHRIIQENEWKKLESALEKLIRKAKATKEVTVSMAIAASGVDVSERVALDAFHEHGIYFHHLYEKPVLEPEDVPARLAWARLAWVSVHRGHAPPWRPPRLPQPP